MAVDANTYGTVARVEARVGDLVSGRTFSVSTTPTLAQVEEVLDDMASRLNMELRANGYTVPVANSGADVEAFAYLRGANSAGAAATVLNMLPGIALDPDGADENSNRRSGLWAEFKAALKYINSGALPATRGITGETQKAFAGSQEDADGNIREPIFTRERTSQPSVWPP